MKRKQAFEIFYADGSIVVGTTKKAFEKAPEHGIQFVIVREKDGSLTVNKAAESYEYRGAIKKGEWTDRENYERLKAGLRSGSKLLVAPVDPRERRWREGMGKSRRSL